MAIFRNGWDTSNRVDKEKTNNCNVADTDQTVEGDLFSPSVLVKKDETLKIVEKIEKPGVSDWDVIWLAFTIIVENINIVLNLYTVTRYLTTEKYVHFAWTLGFIVVSNAVKTFFSFWLFYIKMQRRSTSPSSTNCVWQWVSYVFLCLFQLAPLMHDLDNLRSALKSQRSQRRGEVERQRYYYMKMLEAAPNIALLKIFECFLESAPLQLLQVTLLLGNSSLQTIDLVSCSWSMMGMGWSIANYHRTIKRVQTKTENTNICGIIIDVNRHSLIIVSRIVCICSAGTICLKSTVAACILHWAAMTIWLAKDPHGVDEFSKDISGTPLVKLTTCKKIGRQLFASSLGIIYIFAYVNPGTRSTNLRHVIYHVLCFVENTIVICLWIKYRGDTFKNQADYELLTFFFLLACSLTMTFTIIDYKYTCFHGVVEKERDPLFSVNIEMDGGLGPSEIEKFRVRCGDAFWLVVSIIMQIISIGLDWYNIIPYFTSENDGHWVLTVVPIVVANLVKMFFSYQITCSKKKRRTQTMSFSIINCGWQWWVIYVVLGLLQMVLPIHDFDNCHSAGKSLYYQYLREEQLQHDYYEQMLEAAPNIALLNIFDGFLKTAPRQLSKLTILPGNSTETTPTETFSTETIFPIGVWLGSLIIMGWYVANYHRIIKRVRTNTKNTDLCGTIIDSIWHSFVIASRIICIYVAGTICVEGTVIAFILHWAAMTIWLFADTHGVAEFSKDISGTPMLQLVKCKKFGRELLAFSLGIIYVFTYVNPGQRSTNRRHVIHHGICFVENTIVIIYLWIKYPEVPLKNSVPLTIFCVLVPGITLAISVMRPFQSDPAQYTHSTLPNNLRNSPEPSTADSNTVFDSNAIPNESELRRRNAGSVSRELENTGPASTSNPMMTHVQYPLDGRPCHGAPV